MWVSLLQLFHIWHQSATFCTLKRLKKDKGHIKTLAPEIREQELSFDTKLIGVSGFIVGDMGF